MVDPKNKVGSSIQTKACMVAIAQIIFARNGYSQAHTRVIAQGAGVSPSLIIRHFGSKEGLFAAALSDAARLEELLQGPRENLGLRLVTSIAPLPSSAKWPAMLALAAGDPHANTIASKVIASQLIEPLSSFLGKQETVARAENIVMICTALALHSHRLTDGRPTSATLNWTADAIQKLIDGC